MQDQSDSSLILILNVGRNIKYVKGENEAVEDRDDNVDGEEDDDSLDLNIGIGAEENNGEPTEEGTNELNEDELSAKTEDIDVSTEQEDSLLGTEETTDANTDNHEGEEDNDLKDDKVCEKLELAEPVVQSESGEHDDTAVAMKGDGETEGLEAEAGDEVTAEDEENLLLEPQDAVEDDSEMADSVPNDILQKRVSLVKQYAWIKEEMVLTSAKSIADYLFQQHLLSRGDHEAIWQCSSRRDAVEQLLKKILMGPNNIFEEFLQSLQERARHIAEKLENTKPTPDEVHEFQLLEKSSLQRDPRPDHKDSCFSLTESDCQTLLYYLNDKITIDIINDSFLSQFFFSIREHTNICVCSMGSEGRVKELLNTMKLCSDEIFSSLCKILAVNERKHVVGKLERKQQTAMKSKQVKEDNTAKDDSYIDLRLVTSMQKSASSLRRHTKKLGFDVDIVDSTGSIVIQLSPTSRDSWRLLEENCTSGKIKDFIPVVYDNDAIQDLLQERVYRLQFTIYTIHVPTDQEGGKKALFHLEREHEAPQEGVPVSDVGHHDSPIEDYMDLLCEELEISTALLMLLKEQKMVEDNIQEDIDKQSSRSKKIKYLLNQVSLHGDRGYEVLKQHIKEANEYLYKELMTRQGVKATDAHLDTSAKVTKWLNATVDHRGPYSKQVFFSGTAILKVEKNVEPTKKEDIDPGTEKRKLEISCPEIINSVCHFTSKSAPTLPAEILRMDDQSIRLYKKALSEGEISVHSILVMVVGNYGVGKTTLTKRLLEEDVDLCARDSTEGIGVHVRRCRVSFADQKWTVLKKDEKVDNVSRRLAQVLAKQSISDTTEGIHEVTVPKTVDDDNANTAEVVPTIDTIPKTPVEVDVTEKSAEGDTDKKAIIKDLKDSISNIIIGKSKDNDYADVAILDFCGQSVFNSTHQIFLSPRGIYLLVTDISEDIDNIVGDDEYYFDSKGAQSCKIIDSINNWLNSIHARCPPGKHGLPPVILVATHADKLDKGRRKELVHMYFEAVRNTFDGKITLKLHVVDADFSIDNSIVDPNIAALQQKIYEVASKQEYWGERIPANWLTLEGALGELRDKGMKIITRVQLQDINNSMHVPIVTEDSLDAFLCFHHDTANILYFNEAGLRDHIFLVPPWLVDGLKSLITAKAFCSKKPHLYRQWRELYRDGILRQTLIEAVWTQKALQTFWDHKDHLLQLMQKLNIIAKMGGQTHDGCYLVPCMLKEAPAISMTDDCIRTQKLCFQTKDGFFPPAIFHGLVAGCVSKLKISRRRDKNLIYCGYACFDIDAEHRMTLYFSGSTIQMWVSRYGEKMLDPNPDLCSEVRKYVLDTLDKVITCLSLPRCSNLEVSVKCPDKEMNELDGMLKIDELLMQHSVDDEIICHTHAEKSHALCCSEMLRYWYADHIMRDSEYANNSPEKILTDKQLCNIASKIGKEYEQLWFELGLSHEKIDQIKLKNPYDVVSQTTKILLSWKEIVGCQANFRVLEQAMVTVGIDTTTALAGISGMEEAHRSILWQHRTDIIKNVANPLDVVEGLFARDMFTESMKQEVEVMVGLYLQGRIQMEAHMSRRLGKKYIRSFRSTQSQISLRIQLLSIPIAIRKTIADYNPTV